MNTSGPMCSWQVAPAVSLKPMVAVSRSVYGAHTWSVSMYAAWLYGSTAPGSAGSPSQVVPFTTSTASVWKR